MEQDLPRAGCSVQEREAKVVDIIQTQMIAFRTADELRHRNVEMFWFGENISILLSLLPLTPLESMVKYDSQYDSGLLHRLEYIRLSGICLEGIS